MNQLYSQLFDAVKKKSSAALKESMSLEADPNCIGPDGIPLLHVASETGDIECLEIILKHYNVNLNITDLNGNSALHVAAKLNNVEIIKVLLNFGVNPNLTNNSGKRAADLATIPSCKNLLTDSKKEEVSENLKAEMIMEIKRDLPTDMVELKSLTAQFLFSRELFQNTFQEKLHKIIKEKHLALYKFKQLEKRYGINENESADIVSRLEYLVQEKDHQEGYTSLFKKQNDDLEKRFYNVEEKYLKNIHDTWGEHWQKREKLLEMALENEKKVLEVVRKKNEAILPLRKENLELKLNLSKITQDFVSENHRLSQGIKELQAEIQALQEQVKSSEQMKKLHEQGSAKLINDMPSVRRIMLEAIDFAKNEAASETAIDERDEASGQIIFVRGENGSKQIKAATIEKLVERLTDAIMENRLKKNMGDGKTNSNPNPVQLRVCNTIKSWMEDNWIDFQEDQALLKKLVDFVQFLGSKSAKLFNILNPVLEKKISTQEDQLVSNRKVNNTPRPKPIIPKSLQKRMENMVNVSQNGTIANKGEKMVNWVGLNFGKKNNEDKPDDFRLKFTDIDPCELARQITLIEYQLFDAIQPREFMDQAWMKPGKEKRAPNICNMTRWCNHITRWVISEIVTIKESLKSRAHIIERVIMLAQNLEKLNNFNGVKNVLAGLQSSAVYRLRHTREAVGAKYLKTFDELSKLTANDLNFKYLRKKVHDAQPPVIPFPGVYQSDLVFFDTCSRNKMENGLINFAKFQKISSYVLDLQQYKQTPYNLEEVIEIQDYVRKYVPLNDDEAYNESLICEPRGS